MDSDDDFTFCQVGSVNQDGLETKKLASDISGITLDDQFSTGSDSKQNNGFLWKDTLPNNASEKQQKVGSLSFNVIDASSSSKQSTGLYENTGSGGNGSSVKNLPEQNIIAKKPAPRAKVPFEKGYSQMDWLKLTRTHPDLAGLKGQSNKRLISMDEVKQHKTEGSMWTVLKGRVYNLTPYMKFHPGGADILRKAVGKDCTSLFNKYHAWVNADFLLEKCLVGTLDDGQSS